MKKFKKLQQPQLVPYSASNTVQLVLNNLDFWPTGFLFELEVAKTDASSPTTNQDALSRVINGLSLTGASRTYLQVQGLDLRPLYWDTRTRLGMRYQGQDMVAGAVTTANPLRLTIPWLCGVNPMRADGSVNWFDDTAAIEPTSDLTLSVAWGAATNLGSNRTVGTSTVLRVTPFGVQPASGSEPKMYPNWRLITWAPTQTYANESGLVYLDNGYYYRRSSLLFLSGASPADNRSDGLNASAISEIAFTNYTGEKALDEKIWTFTQESQGHVGVTDDNGAIPGATLAGGASIVGAGWNPGVAMVDYVRYVDTSSPVVVNGQNIGPDPLYGLNLLGKQVGSAKFGFTVDANTNTKLTVLHESYLPYQS